MAKTLPTTEDKPMGLVFGKVAGGAQVRRPVLGAITRLRSEGNGGELHAICNSARSRSPRSRPI
jgi:hypothetical protein